MKTDFLASANNFLPFYGTTVNCYQWKQFILQPGHIFQLILVISASVNEFFVCWKQYQFIPNFFCQWKLLLKLGESQFLKTDHIPATGHHFFFIFSDIFYSVSSFFIAEMCFSTNPLQGQWKQIFCLMEIVHFNQSFFSASGNHYRNQFLEETISTKKNLFLLVDN